VTESKNAEQLTNDDCVFSFGECLQVERKKQNLSLAEVATAIHLSEKIVEAIESSDVEQLPQPAFVQGYLRAYAKYLGISEAKVLEEYSKAVPHKQEADLQPRSMLPSEASSDSPFVKTITILLLVMMVAAALYASFDYYKKAIMADETDQQDRAILSLPEADQSEQQDNDYDASSEFEIKEEVIQQEANQEVDAKTPAVNADVKVSEPVPSSKIAVEQVSDKATADDAASQRPTNQLSVEGDDNLELFAEQVSWVEVDDVNAENLYYDLLQIDQRVILKGTAPFKIFLGNAPQVKVKINDMPVNIEKYIRSNNIAHFKISVDQQQIVFH